MPCARSSLLLCVAFAGCGCTSFNWHREERTAYMGAGVGHARAATDDCEPGYVDFGNTCSVSSGANSGGKLFGGYQFNRYVAVEGEHARLGTFTENLSGHTCCPVIPAAPKTDTRAYAADLVYGVGIWPITQDFGLLGKKPRVVGVLWPGVVGVGVYGAIISRFRLLPAPE